MANVPNDSERITALEQRVIWLENELKNKEPKRAVFGPIKPHKLIPWGSQDEW